VVWVRQEFLELTVLQVPRVLRGQTETQVRVGRPELRGPLEHLDPLVHKVLRGCLETLFQDLMELPDHQDQVELQVPKDQ